MCLNWIDVGNIIRKEEFIMKKLKILKAGSKGEVQLKDEEIRELHEELKVFRHDYGNFLQAVDGYTKLNNMDGIRKLCEDAKNEYFYNKFQ